MLHETLSVRYGSSTESDNTFGASVGSVAAAVATTVVEVAAAFVGAGTFVAALVTALVGVTVTWIFEVAAAVATLVAGAMFVAALGVVGTAVVGTDSGAAA